MNILCYYRKKIWIGTIKVAAFILIFFLLFHIVTELFRIKNNYSAVKPFYDLSPNSIDVLLFGSSHMARTISPMDLWSEYGITSFNAGFDDQTIPISYFELREFLEVQSPKVVVLETFYIFREEMLPAQKERLHWFVDNVPFSLGINEAIQTLVEEDDNKIEYYLNFYSFHNRWRELSREDFNPSQGYNRGALTFHYSHSLGESPTIIPKYLKEIPPDLPLEYLRKIIELCRKKGISLVLMAQPYNANSDVQKKMNYIDVISEQEGIPYINFFYLLDEIGFDFENDMAEWSHVNYFGVKKLTSYLGEYLQTNYQLEDHRKDSEIAILWNKDYETFALERNNIMLKMTESTGEYFDYLKNEDYIIAWNAYSENLLCDTPLSKYMKSIGIRRPMIKENQYYCAITKGNKLIYKKGQDKRLNFTYMIEDTLFSFGAGIIGGSNRIGVHVGRDEYSVGNIGLNLVVYDPTSRIVVDNVNIDLETGEIKRK